ARVAGGPAAPPSRGVALPASVALRADGDPFAAALADCLHGLGLMLDAHASPIVLAGGDDATAHSLVDARTGLVAIGDAAAHVLLPDPARVAAQRPARARAAARRDRVCGRERRIRLMGYFDATGSPRAGLPKPSHPRSASMTEAAHFLRRGHLLAGSAGAL